MYNTYLIQKSDAPMLSMTSQLKLYILLVGGQLLSTKETSQ